MISQTENNTTTYAFLLFNPIKSINSKEFYTTPNPLTEKETMPLPNFSKVSIIGMAILDYSFIMIISNLNSMKKYSFVVILSYNTQSIIT